MKNLVQLVVLAWLSGWAVPPAQAAFSSLYVFGDGTCSTTGGPGGSIYYQNTYSNGRIWIQVLAQRQGITYQASKNPSDEWHDSSTNLALINQFSAADASTSLFVLWFCDADFVDYMQYGPYPTLDTNLWNSYISASLTRHSQAITTLYNKGARTLIMPNAVDISQVPLYSYEWGLTASAKSFIRGRVAYFNSGFNTVVSQARASLSGIKIIVPDFFSLLDNMLAHPGNYGLVNPGYAALEDASLDPWSLTGPGAYYVFWDPWDPTAKAHEIMADTVEPMLSPVTFTQITSLGASNRLDVINMPIGLSGFVDGRTNLALGSWTLGVTNFNSISATQAIYVRTSSPVRYYRLRFPFAWTSP